MGIDRLVPDETISSDVELSVISTSPTPDALAGIKEALAECILGKDFCEEDICLLIPKVVNVFSLCWMGHCYGVTNVGCRKKGKYVTDKSILTNPTLGTIWIPRGPDLGLKAS